MKGCLQRIWDPKVTLNPEKCVFHQPSKFLGHIVDQDGIHADPEKTKAIQQMKAPENVAAKVHGDDQPARKIHPEF